MLEHNIYRSAKYCNLAKQMGIIFVRSQKTTKQKSMGRKIHLIWLSY